ncbi:hypothetical protein LU293_00075 [Moraxella nasovis]|uniref:hypothetical protein n=1 Tax=Moraxella nasovis TaxID=2904121 RepID=UPI001F6189E6|nr:hypothetical protein [Moraxella nasovis]UNU73350.1 hypothetical protein LU293_00075 [Moraxella nasovis]
MIVGGTTPNANHLQVTHQSGIQANTSTLTVDGKGIFTGGYLLTTDEQGNQTNFKGGIITQDMQNHLTYDGSANSIGIAVSGKGISPTSLGYGIIDPTHQTSTTYSAVTGQAGQAHATIKDKDSLNQTLQNSFDEQAFNRELGLQTQISTEFGRQAPRVVAQFSQNQINNILEQLNDPNLSQDQAEQILDEAKKWDEGGIYSVALHTAMGALGTGSTEGALATGTVATIAPNIQKLEDYLTKQLTKDSSKEQADKARQTAKGLISFVMLATGQTAGLDPSSTMMATNVEMNNRQLHGQEKQLARVLVQKAKQKGLKRSDGQSYTLQDIEDALRWANSGKYKERYDSNSNVAINKYNVANANKLLYDNAIGDDYKKDGKRLWKSYSQDGVTVMRQNFNNIKKPDTELINLIQKQTPSYQYTWNKEHIKGYQAPPKITTPRKVVKAPIYPQSAMDRKNATIKRSGVDLSSSANIQAKSDKIMNEKVMPVVQVGIGATEVVAGSAMCTTALGCTAGVALITNGVDNVATGGYNYGKSFSQQTNSVALTKGVGLSENTAANVKLGVDLASGVGAGKAVTKTVGKSTVSKVDVSNNQRLPDVYGDGDLGSVLDVPPYTIRQDNNFYSEINERGNPKAYLDKNGNLVPANVNGRGTIQTHIRGSNPSETPYISTIDPSIVVSPKKYAKQQIIIDTQNLQKDIDNGVVKDIEIVTPKQIISELQDKINKAQNRYDKNPSNKNRNSLDRAKSDLKNAMRDGECLIKGIVPCNYIKKK